MNLRLGVAILAGRLAACAIRAIRAGGATTAPGRIARAVAPDLVGALGSRLPQGTVLVTATNGKTTTARLLAAMLAATGLRPIHNRAGANLPAGIATVLVAHATAGGHVHGDLGVFEVDEAALPVVARALPARVLILGNLFRDQLDRYGEVDLVADRWRAALAHVTPGGTVVYNADDPLVGDVARGAASSLTFGLEDPEVRRGAVLEHAADARYCYRCGIPYEYAAVYFGHLGLYQCRSCGVSRSRPGVFAEDIQLRGVSGSTFTIITPAGSTSVTTRLPGLYNVYNILAATGAAQTLGVPLQTIAATVAGFAPAFGRGEEVLLEGHPVHLLLAKNPAGFNEVLRTLPAADALVTVIAINDLAADGHDISWLWDVDFELLQGTARLVVATGIRGRDLMVRLKYAGLDGATVIHEEVTEDAVRRAIGALRSGEPLYVIPTYTAMLRLRALLSRQGHVRAFWED